MLKRVLLLALVLDRAVQSQYKPIGCPPLFRVQRRSDDAAAAVLLKRSSDVVVQCLSESVAGSGDVLRHLKVNFKYTLSHEQTSIMEANFAVSNVATDLRDGMRLCKLVDALASPTPPAMDGVKYPADKRALQLHNVSVALASFKACGSSVVSPTSSEEAYAREIVDGHRETTLAVLWSIYAEHQVSRLVCTPEVSHDTLTALETWIASKQAPRRSGKGWNGTCKVPESCGAGSRASAGALDCAPAKLHRGGYDGNRRIVRKGIPRSLPVVLRAQPAHRIRGMCIAHLSAGMRGWLPPLPRCRALRAVAA